MDLFNTYLDRVADEFTDCFNKNHDFVTPGGNKSPIPPDSLTDEAKFLALTHQFSMFSEEEIKQMVNEGKTPFKAVRDFVISQIDNLDEIFQLRVLEGILDSQCRDLDDLQNFINAEIELVINPENY